MFQTVNQRTCIWGHVSMIMGNVFCDCYQDWQKTSARRLQPKVHKAQGEITCKSSAAGRVQEKGERERYMLVTEIGECVITLILFPLLYYAYIYIFFIKGVSDSGKGLLSECIVYQWISPHVPLLLCVRWKKIQC